MKSVFNKIKMAASGLALVVASLAATSNIALAGDRTARADIVSVRSYLDGSYFVTLTAAGANLQNGAGSCTTVYKVPGSAAGAKTLIATLLTAKASGSSVELEVPTGCPTGWGQEIISAFVF